MSLLSIDATAAFEQARSNPNNTWPQRDTQDNRVEPWTKPFFAPTFKIDKKDSVFTIGSCFARNVETYLERMGFDIPMKKLKIVEDGGGDDVSEANIFNNYAVPSILNELEWALDDTKPFDPDSCLLEVNKGGYCDLHLTRLMKPVPVEVAMGRRDRIRTAMTTVRHCRVVIITLGLVEVWWDNLAKRYLNIAPPKQAAKRYPDRFELRVMDYSEVIDHLHRIMALLKTHCRPDVRVLLTVSPIPLGITFTNQDVIVANCYSKSVLRAAAQEIWQKYDIVDYYPSYESVVMSDRLLALQPDMRHATHDVIQLNVQRMVSAYIEDDGSNVELDLMEAQSAEKQRRVADAIAAYERVLKTSNPPIVATLGYARCLGDKGRVEEAVGLLKPLLDHVSAGNDALHAYLKVIRANKLADDYKALESRIAETTDPMLLREMIVTLFDLRSYDEVVRLSRLLIELSPRMVLPYEYIGWVAVRREAWGEARDMLLQAADVNQNSTRVYSLLGRAQLELGEFDNAQDSLRRAIHLNRQNKLALECMAELQERMKTAGRVPQPT